MRAGVTPAKPPIMNPLMPSVDSGKSVVSVSMPADRMLESATPESTTVMRDAPMRSASVKTASDATSAPRNAAAGMS